MNRYLLLRDNKQSGPYTVPEIIAKGIKPYDLVWLEGKSAAWRYPSEVEELKAYAPAVEEQPFDRFYKKPENKKPAQEPQVAITEKHEVKKEVVAESHERYQPKTETASQAEGTSKKVYINFPSTAPAKPTPKSEPVAPVEKVETFVMNEQPAESKQPVRTLPVYKERKTEDPEQYLYKSEHTGGGRKPGRMFQVTVAACILLGLVTGVLFFNYYRQRESLNQLNSLVQEIQNREKQQQAVPATLVQNDAPAEPLPAPPAESSIDPIVNHNAAVNEVIEPAPEIAKKTPAKKITNEVSPGDQAAVVFRENKPGERPVERRGEPKEETTPPAIATKDNLYNMVDVKPNAYKTGLLGGISNLKFELTNKSEVELQRVAVEVKYLGPEKKVVKKHTIYFQNISPGAQSTIEVPKSNRGVTIEYTITDIKS